MKLQGPNPGRGVAARLDAGPPSFVRTLPPSVPEEWKGGPPGVTLCVDGTSPAPRRCKLFRQHTM